MSLYREDRKLNNILRVGADFTDDLTMTSKIISKTNPYIEK
jgi:hypothetical protein